MSDYYDNLKVFDELKIKPRLGIFSEQECVLCEEIRKQDTTIRAQQRVLNGLAEMLGVAEGDVDGLISEVERLKKDAERYRWLRGNGYFRNAGPRMDGNHAWCSHGAFIGEAPTVDQAIDKALAAGEAG